MRTALCVLAAAITLLLSYSSPQADESYAALVAKKAAILEDLHKRISSSLVTVAQDRAFGEYFVVQDPARRAELKQRIDEISLKTQDKFRVEEMCLIDASGAEVSRIVGSVVAYDLAPDETGAVFFAPGFAQPNRQVYVSPPYVSPDAPKWVIGYATPIIVDGATQAVLHFEHGLDVFQRVLSAQSLPGGSYMQAVTDNGRIIFDSRHEIDIDKKGDSELAADYLQSFHWADWHLPICGADFGDGKAGTGEIEQNGDRWKFAYRQVGTWTLIVAGSQPSS